MFNRLRLRWNHKSHSEERKTVVGSDSKKSNEVTAELEVDEISLPSPIVNPADNAHSMETPWHFPTFTPRRAANPPAHADIYSTFLGEYHPDQYKIAGYRIPITRIDPEMPLPEFSTRGAVGFDIYARTTISIPPRTVGLIPSNLIIEVPQGYVLLVALRSSSPKRLGLLMPHGVGVIDNDFCGPDDEIQVQVYNFKSTSCLIEKGNRVAQGIFIRTDRFTWNEDAPRKESRGGFGSTG